MTWPDPPEVSGVELESFVVCEVVKNLRQTLQGAAFTSPAEPSRVAQFLVGVRGHLFSIGGDFSGVSTNTLDGDRPGSPRRLWGAADPGRVGS